MGFLPVTNIIRRKRCFFTLWLQEVIHIISYNPLWNTMKEKGITQYILLREGIDNKTLDGLKKEKNITLLTVEKLCKIMDCTPNDIVEFK